MPPCKSSRLKTGRGLGRGQGRTARTVSDPMLVVEPKENLNELPHAEEDELSTGFDER